MRSHAAIEEGVERGLDERLAVQRPMLSLGTVAVRGLSVGRQEAARGERQELAVTGFSPRQPLADLGMASTRVERRLPGASLAYRFRPQAASGDRPL